MDGTWSTSEIRDAAHELIRHLKGNIRDTHGRSEWTAQNLSLLRSFAAKKKSKDFPTAKETSASERRGAFLWDFIAYTQGRGILLAAESEFENSKDSILIDFDKLLYVRSALKVMLCRVDSEKMAKLIRDWLEEFMKGACREYSPSEAFVLYCVWWAGADGKNRDIAFVLQVNGDPHYVAITGERFEQFES